jgi:hypothetical protein
MLSLLKRNPLFILFVDCANFTTNVSPRNGNLNLLVQIKFLNLLAHRAKGNKIITDRGNPVE